MRFTPILAFGLGQVAMAQNSTFTSNTPTGTSSSAIATSTSRAGFPSQLGPFGFYGCVASVNGFPTFELIGNSPDMSLDMCAATCPGRFFGVFNTDCYCGEEIDTRTTTRVPNDQCNVECPGNDLELCGGVQGRQRRQNVPLAILLSLYIRLENGATTSGSMTAPPTPASTVTETITSAHTITSCPPEVINCPYGRVTTTTYTTEYCPQPTPDFHKKVVVCYGDYCVPEKPCHGPECVHHRVVCEGEHCRPEVCENEEYYKKVVCNGDECLYPTCEGDACHKKVVCYGDHCLSAKCYGDECEKNYVCHGDNCGYESCHGDECYKQLTCQGENCKVVEPCHGDHCPLPTPPKPVCNGAACNQVVPVPKPTATPIAYHNNGEKPCSGEGCTVLVGGSEKILPAIGMGAIAAVAFFL